MQSHLVTDGENIATSFFEQRDMGESIRYVKSMVRVVSNDNFSGFVRAVSDAFRRRGTSVLWIRSLPTSPRVENGILANFINDLLQYWPLATRHKFSQLLDGVLKIKLSGSETIALLNECIDITKRSVGTPTIALFHVSQLPYSLEALHFIRAVKALATVTAFPWLIVAPNPILMLFMGEPRAQSNRAFYGYRSKRVNLNPSTQVLAFSTHVYDVSKRDWLFPGEMISLGSSALCNIPVTVWGEVDGIALYESNESTHIIVSFTPRVGFQLAHELKKRPITDARNETHLQLQWKELNLELDVGQHFPRSGEEVNVFKLTAGFTNNDVNARSYGVLPSRSVIRLRVEGPRGSRDFILAIRSALD